MTKKLTKEESKKNQYLFNLSEAFKQDVLNLNDVSIFTKGLQEWNHAKTVSMPKCRNKYIENEIRGFLMYFCIEKKHATNYCEQFFIHLSQFARYFDYKDYKVITIIELPLDKLEKEFIEYGVSQGWKIDNYVKQHKRIVPDTHTWKSQNSKTKAIYALNAYYKYIEGIKVIDTRSEYDKDIWELEKLGISYNSPIHRPIKHLSFKSIKQEWFKKMVKDFTYYSLPIKSAETVVEYIAILNRLSDFLCVKKIDDFKSFDRKLAQQFLRYVSKFQFSNSYYDSHISTVNKFIQIGLMREPDNYPVKPLFMKSDYRKKKTNIPVYFTDNELKQMNEHICDLSVVLQRMFFIEENCGMRVSDACATTIYVNDKDLCIKENANGKFFFTYIQPKVHSYNTIPVTPLVAAVINEQIEESIKLYGKDCKYLFAVAKNLPVSSRRFVDNLNRMCLKFDLKKDDGRPLFVRGHTFRKTVATHYANLGIDPDLIRRLLGQKSLGNLKHYVTIHSTTMIDYLNPIIEEDDYRIKNIGNNNTKNDYEDDNNSVYIPLFNGECKQKKKGKICSNITQCYECKMFKPSKEYLPFFKKQLNEVNSSILFASLYGYERILEINNRQKEDLENIISKLEGGVYN